MVDELTQESFQTGKAVVTVSVELVQAIVDACRKSEQANSAMTCEQKDGLLKKVVDKAVSNYKETHGSLKTFNRDGVDIAHLDVTDERTAEIIADVCKKNHIPVDLKEIPRADGTYSYTAFCQVKDVDQLSAVLKMASEQVLEEQKSITKELVLFNESGEPVMSQSFVREPEIDYDKLQKAADHAVWFQIRDGNGKVISGDTLIPGGAAHDKAGTPEVRQEQEHPDRRRIRRRQDKGLCEAEPDVDAQFLCCYRSQGISIVYT